MDALHEVLDPWLGKPKRNQSEGRVTLLYRFDSEDATPLPLRLKVEVNSREHFSAYGYTRVPFRVASRWFEGSCQIQTYELDELLETKLRALYQRRKGRDLFDLAKALETSDASAPRIVASFSRYMEHGGHRVTRAQFERNLHSKLRDPRFTADIEPFLGRGHSWNIDDAAAIVSEQLIRALPGDPWKGVS